MTSHRGSWIGSSLVAAAVLLVPTATTVRAQPGFGADPFWPYNNQYTPYTRAIGPAGPEGGQGGYGARSAYVGANQFDDYLNSLQGPGRNISDRSNIGMPYYRSSVDPNYQPRGRGPRQYQPNVRSTERFEESQRRAAEIYFQYYSERDPSRRAALLREYRAARRQSSAIAEGGRVRRRTTSPTARRRSAATRNTRSRSVRSGSNIGAAPEVPAVGTPRTYSRSGRTRTQDILNRSHAMERESLTSPRPAASRPRSVLRGRNTTTPAPSPDNR